MREGYGRQEEDMATLRPRLVPAARPRRRAGWPAEVSAAVDRALDDGEARAPQGARHADGERALTARRQERDLPTAALRHLGPRIAPEEVLISAEEARTRRDECASK